jgi:VanZ family protein
MKKETRLLAIAARFGLVFSVIYISIRSTTPGFCESGFTLYDKFEHFFAFFMLSLLLDFAFPAAPFNPVKISLLLLYGAGIELAQLFVPFRDCDLVDFAADVFGIALYFFAVPLIRLIPVLKYRWHEEE